MFRFSLPLVATLLMATSTLAQTNAYNGEVQVPGATLPQGAAVMPQQDFAERKPLMVIRFNQKRVYFERALRTTISRAESVKPNAIYDVVSVLPQPKTGEVRERDAELAKGNQVAVAQALREMQIPEGRLRQSIRADASIAAQEVRIYVQ